MVSRRRALQQCTDLEAESDLRLERTCARLSALTVVPLGPHSVPESVPVAGTSPAVARTIAEIRARREAAAAAAAARDDGGEGGPAEGAGRPGERESDVVERGDEGRGAHEPPAGQHRDISRQIVDALRQHHQRTEATKHVASVRLDHMDLWSEEQILWGGYLDLLRVFQESYPGDLLCAAHVHSVLEQNLGHAIGTLENLREKHEHESDADAMGDGGEHGPHPVTHQPPEDEAGAATRESEGGRARSRASVHKAAAKRNAVDWQAATARAREIREREAIEEERRAAVARRGPGSAAVHQARHVSTTGADEFVNPELYGNSDGSDTD